MYRLSTGLSLIPTIKISQKQLAGLEVRLQNWADKYDKFLDFAIVRSALRGLLTKKQYRRGEQRRVEPGARLVKGLVNMLPPQSKVLEVPCATGHYAASPANLAAYTVQKGCYYFAADAVPRAVVFTEKRILGSFRKLGILESVNKTQSYVATHDTALDFFGDGELGLVFVFELFLHLNLDEIGLFIKKAKRKIKPGGFLVFSFPALEDNNPEEYDSERTLIHPRRSVTSAMRGWKKMAEFKVDFFDAEIQEIRSKKDLAFSAERVLHLAYQNCVGVL